MAEQLHRTLVGFSASITEPTDTGFLRGYELELQTVAGALEHQLVFVADDQPDSGVRPIPEFPGVLAVPVDGYGTLAPVWLYPADPGLPSLRTVTDVVSAGTLLESLGVKSVPRSVKVVSYRPGRRAVVRVDSDTQSLFVKIVEPGKAESISERHDLFRSSGLPVPRILGWSPDGVIAMSGLPGVEAQSAIARIRDHAAFVEQVEFVCSILAAVPAVNTARPSLYQRLDWYLDRLTAILPDEAERIQQAGRAVTTRGIEGYSFEYTPVTIHGDLHLGQLFVDSENPSVVAGLLDIDTAGVGDPADDAGAFYAHVIALVESLAATDEAASAEAFRLAETWRSRWRRSLNAGYEARASAIGATHLLGHALQPRSVNSHAISRRLLAHAERLVGLAPVD